MQQWVCIKAFYVSEVTVGVATVFYGRRIVHWIAVGFKKTADWNRWKEVIKAGQKVIRQNRAIDAFMSQEKNPTKHDNS